MQFSSLEIHVLDIENVYDRNEDIYRVPMSLFIFLFIYYIYVLYLA